MPLSQSSQLLLLYFLLRAQVRHVHFLYLSDVLGNFVLVNLVEVLGDGLVEDQLLAVLLFNEPYDLYRLPNRQDVLDLLAQEDWNRDFYFGRGHLVIEHSKKVVLELSQVDRPEYETLEPLLS